MSDFNENKTPNTDSSDGNYGANNTNSYSQNNYNPNNANQYGQNNCGYNRQNNGYYGSNGYGHNPNYVYNDNSYRQNRPFNASYNTGHSNDGYVVNGEFVPSNSTNGNKKGKKIFIIILCAAVVIGLIAMIYAGIKGTESEKVKVDGPTLSIEESDSAAMTDATGELTGVGVYEKIKESSVGILVYSGYSNTTLSGEGSGVIVGADDNGEYTYVITCSHVVSDGGIIKVQLHDESQYDATLVGYDAKTDIAVLRIHKSGLSALEIGDSDTLRVGETVYAIGNPGGTDFAGSFTNGMVSAIARPINSEIGYEMNCIQHTAAINPGNSGGALVNSKGQLIGINSSKISSTDYEGMGFAVPSSTFVEVYNDIVKNGYVTNRAKLGITYTPAQSSQTYSMLVGVKGLPAGSLVIKSISTDSPLVNTQVTVGDLIIKVNGEELDTADKLPDIIENSSVGDELTLTVCHIDNNYQLTEFDVKVVLVEDKGDTSTYQETTTQAYNPFSYFYGQGSQN